MPQCFGGGFREPETEEAYVAELKCIYGKAYLKHDCSTEDEDLLQRFLNGLADEQAQQQTEYVKDPGNIDDVLDEVMKYREMHQSV